MTIGNGINTYISRKYYFRLTYYDYNCIYPKLDTVVYLGNASELRGKLQTEECFLYFQDAESYANHGFLNSHGHKLDKDEIIVMETSEAIAKKTIFDIDGIVQELIKIRSQLEKL